MKPFKHVLPVIPLQEQTPTVHLLLTIIEQQQETIQQHQERIETLKAEIARLKKLSQKPKIRPSTLPKDDDEPDDNDTDL